ATRERHPRVDVQQSTAEQLPFPDGTFDAALAQLVVHFMADAIAGLREMARVTRRGGVVAASVWDFAGGRSPISVLWQAAREVDADVGDESSNAGGRTGHLGELFREVGLDAVEETELAAAWTFATFEEWWEPF